MGAHGTAYHHLVILDVIIKSWFSNHKDEGITEESFFNAPGILLVTIALVFAAVRQFSASQQLMLMSSYLLADSELS